MNNRTIKFRVWDEKYRCWETDRQEFYPEHNIVKQGRIFQQFTGLLDKNGKEIYEGDIMTGRDTPIVVCYNAPEFSFKYKTNDGGFCSYYLVGWADFEGEIIGNIFENPDLLK